MEMEKIFSLIDKAEKSSFNKINIKINDVTLYLERDGCVRTVEQPAKPAKEKPAVKHEYDSDDIVFAPISGVFYVAKEPGAEPFATEGSRVAKGDVLCIIEAMKMMNEICAPKSGVIERVLKKDGEAIVAKDGLFKYAKEK
ncbi:MAG: acetyl-CoA carboxylase biotin carboxyl carrier protein [Christensenellales bacterium]|jgi:acetyl-CoA carboxylase biotin carboxyl carrier protein